MLSIIRKLAVYYVCWICHNNFRYDFSEEKVCKDAKEQINWSKLSVQKMNSFVYACFLSCAEVLDYFSL